MEKKPWKVFFFKKDDKSEIFRTGVENIRKTYSTLIDGQAAINGKKDQAMCVWLSRRKALKSGRDFFMLWWKLLDCRVFQQSN